ncbi:hypothetical protein NHQ30_011341 [Ciborinia camelliae]|nr:hypothetical protein NHQ30_011341 [Ciborinia camelliae]
MYDLMASGMFGHVDKRTITEEGCAWWTGLPTNKNAKARTRSTGENVVKIPMTVQAIAPGIKFAVSHEYMFTGRIVRPEYSSVMEEYMCETVIECTSVRLISRMYINGDEHSYASEIEIISDITHELLRMLLNTMVSVVGSIQSLSNEIDPELMTAIRRAEHAVVDVRDISPYKGIYMPKTNGVKVYVFCYSFGYVFCYSFGYVVTATDNNLTVRMLKFALIGTPMTLRMKPPTIDLRYEHGPVRPHVNVLQHAHKDIRDGPGMREFHEKRDRDVRCREVPGVEGDENRPVLIYSRGPEHRRGCAGKTLEQDQHRAVRCEQALIHADILDI